MMRDADTIVVRDRPRTRAVATDWRRIMLDTLAALPDGSIPPAVLAVVERHARAVEIAARIIAHTPTRKVQS